MKYEVKNFVFFRLYSNFDFPSNKQVHAKFQHGCASSVSHSVTEKLYIIKYYKRKTTVLSLMKITLCCTMALLSEFFVDKHEIYREIIRLKINYFYKDASGKLG